MYFHVNSLVLLIMLEGGQLIPPVQLSMAVTLYCQVLFDYVLQEQVGRHECCTRCKILIDHSLKLLSRQVPVSARALPP